MIPDFSGSCNKRKRLYSVFHFIINLTVTVSWSLKDIRWKDVYVLSSLAFFIFKNMAKSVVFSWFIFVYIYGGSNFSDEFRVFKFCL